VLSKADQFLGEVWVNCYPLESARTRSRSLLPPARAQPSSHRTSFRCAGTRWGAVAEIAGRTPAAWMA